MQNQPLGEIKRHGFCFKSRFLSYYPNSSDSVYHQLGSNYGIFCCGLTFCLLFVEFLHKVSFFCGISCYLNSVSLHKICICNYKTLFCTISIFPNFFFFGNGWFYSAILIPTAKTLVFLSFISIYASLQNSPISTSFFSNSLNRLPVSILFPHALDICDVFSFLNINHFLCLLDLMYGCQ